MLHPTAAMKRLLKESASDQAFQDLDPWNTEWAAAVRHVRRYTRKPKRRFLDLWLKDLDKNRQPSATSIVSGGSSIQSPIVSGKDRCPRCGEALPWTGKCECVPTGFIRSDAGDFDC